MELTSSSTSSGTLDTDIQSQTPPPPPPPNPNGSLNLLRHNNTVTPSTVVVSYKECLRNHAASLGGHALDGCCEFIPSLEPLSLTCAACECHRNFHRRYIKQLPNPTFISFYPISPSPGPSPSPSPSPPHYHTNGKKRHRTKFSEEQKEKMLEFCEKLGWRMPLANDDDPTVQDFCNTVGVSRRIFKVWMHNNKNRKKSSSSI